MYDNNKTKDTEHGGWFDYEGRAEAVRKAQQALHNYRADRKIFRTWRKALANAYPPHFWENLDLLRNRDPAAVPLAIEFLEADPWFFRTGYVKERLIRYMLRLDLTATQTARIQDVILATIDKRYRREIRSYCQLARKVDSPEFREKLNERLTDPNPDIRRRTQWVLDGLEQGVPKKGKYWQWAIERRNAPLSSDFLAAIKRLRSGEGEPLVWAEWAVGFLEELSLFNWEGRMRRELVHALLEMDLPIDYKLRLQKIVLTVVDTCYPYGFDQYCQLASTIGTPEFRLELAERLENPDYHIRRRAQLILNVLR